MATETFKVEGSIRETRGKGPARRTRATGMVPAILYGAKKESISLTVNSKQVAKILRSETGHNTIFTVHVEKGDNEKAMVKDWQVDPVSGRLLHVDLLRIDVNVRMRVKVPVHTTGEPQGVKIQGGVFEVVSREVEIECLPGDIPSHIDVNVTGLGLNSSIRVADLPRGGKIKFITDENATVAHVVAIKEEVAPAVDAVAAAAPAEPEVAKKGKTETPDPAAEKGGKK